MAKFLKLKKGFIGGKTTLEITCPYGKRANGDFHYGVDVRVPVGTPIYAPFDGFVRRAIQPPARRCAGLFIGLKKDDVELMFMHMSAPTLKCPTGNVKEGTIIGYTGGALGDKYAGSSLGPHLHFETRYKGEKVDPRYSFSDELTGKVNQPSRADLIFTSPDEPPIEQEAPLVGEPWQFGQEDKWDVPDQEMSSTGDDNIDISTIDDGTEGGDDTSIEERNKLVDETTLHGIWQIVKMVMDKDVANLRVQDASTSIQAGSLASFFQKVCQKPFVEFSGDTYGDQYYFTVRKPPFDKDGMLKTLDSQGLLSESTGYNPYIIPEEELVNSSLSFNTQGIYSWYQFIPLYELGSAAEMQYVIPAVFFPEYAVLWGSRDLSVRSMYRNFIGIGVRDKRINGEQTEHGDYEVRQSIHDLHYLIESNAYNPFTRSGSITLRGNRQLKRGMFVKLRWLDKGGGYFDEIFYVDTVSHSYSISARAVNRTTTLQLSHGMIAKFVTSLNTAEEEGHNLNSTPNYFNLIDFGDYDKWDKRITMDNWREVISSWKVNTAVFDFFLKKMQFLTVRGVEWVASSKGNNNNIVANFIQNRIVNNKRRREELED